MKTFVKPLVVGLAIAFIISCNNPHNILISKNGTWTATYETTIGSFGTFTDVKTITFYEGSATVVDTAGVKSSFNWYYDKKGGKIVTNSYLPAFGHTDVYTTRYSISESSANSEKWTYESLSKNDSTITTTDYSQTISLVRK